MQELERILQDLARSYLGFKPGSCRDPIEAFCSEWGIEHITSSPYYPQSNGFSDRMVQTVQNLLKKSEAAGEDPYLALLSY